MCIQDERGCTCPLERVAVSGQLCDVSDIFHVGSETKLESPSLPSKRFYPLSHLAHPSCLFQVLVIVRL